MGTFFKSFVVAFVLMLTLMCTVFSCNQGAKTPDLPTPAKPDPTPENPLKLTLFKLDGNVQNIRDSMDLGTTKKSELIVDFKTFPQDAELITEPVIAKDRKWTLQDGRNELKITLKKDSYEKKYIAFIEKGDKNSLSITKIKVGDIEKQGDEIFSSTSFPNVKAGVVDVEIATSDPVAQVAFQDGQMQNAKNYKWYLVEGENSLKIKIAKASEQIDYTVHISSTASKTTPKCFLNGVELKDIKDDFAKKIERGENPLLTLSTACLNVMLTTTSTMPGKVVINGKECEYRKRDGTNINLITHALFLKEEETQIELIAWSHVNFAQNVAGNRLRFRVKKSNQKEKITAELEISSDKTLPSDFLSKLESSAEEPLHRVYESPAEIKVKISEYAKEFLVKEIKIDNEKIELQSDYTLTKSIEVSETQAKSVKIEFISANEEIANSLTWSFKVQAGGQKPQVPDVRLYAINDCSLADNTLDSTFLENVGNGKNPTYEIDGKKAIIVVDVLKKDWIEKVTFSIDGIVKNEAAPSVINYKFLRADGTLDVPDTEVHDVEIQAIPIDKSKYSPRVFSFKIKSTGKIPVLPKNKLMLVINEMPDKSMPKEVKEHLTDGTGPLYKIDGTKVKLVLITGIKDIADRIENIRITFADNVPQTLPFTPTQVVTATIYVTEAFFILPNRTDSKLLKVEVLPQDATNWKPLVYSLQLQSTGKKVKMPLTFMIDRRFKASGTEETLDAEKVTVAVKSNDDIMKNITIGEKDTDEIECNKTQISEAWYASREISLIEDGSAVTKIIVIKVEPEDSEEYLSETCTYVLTGTKRDVDITVSNFKLFNIDAKDAITIEVESTVEKLKLENIEFEGVADSINFTKNNLKVYKDSLTNEVTSNVKGVGEELIPGNNTLFFVVEAVKGKYREYKKKITMKRKSVEKELLLKSLKVKGELVLGLDVNGENSPSELRQGITELLLKDVQPTFVTATGDTVLPYWKNKTLSIAKKDGTATKILDNQTATSLTEYIKASEDGVFQIIIDVKKSTGYTAFHKVLYVKVKA